MKLLCSIGIVLNLLSVGLRLMTLASGHGDSTDVAWLITGVAGAMVCVAARDMVK